MLCFCLRNYFNWLEDRQTFLDAHTGFMTYGSVSLKLWKYLLFSWTWVVDNWTICETYGFGFKCDRLERGLVNYDIAHDVWSYFFLFFQKTFRLVSPWTWCIDQFPYFTVLWMIEWNSVLGLMKVGIFYWFKICPWTWYLWLGIVLFSGFTVNKGHP